MDSLEGKVEQLQFRFMRDVNLRCYLYEQRQYFLREYHDLCAGASKRDYSMKWSDFVETAIFGGMAEKYHLARKHHYFGDDHLIPL
jgi:hypothetical protein